MGRVNSNGFGAMDQATHRAAASKGGTTAWARGHLHRFTEEEGRLGARRGGEAVSRDRAHMAEIGRRGGRARRGTESC